jgi:hypothetical protein
VSNFHDIHPQPTLRTKRCGDRITSSGANLYSSGAVLALPLYLMSVNWRICKLSNMKYSFLLLILIQLGWF